MIKCNLVWMLMIAFHLLLLQGSLALTNDIHVRHSISATGKRKPSAALADTGDCCPDTVAGDGMGRRSKRDSPNNEDNQPNLEDEYYPGGDPNYSDESSETPDGDPSTNDDEGGDTAKPDDTTPTPSERHGTMARAALPTTSVKPSDYDKGDYIYSYDDEDPVLERVTRVGKGQFPFIVAVERSFVGEPVICAGSILTDSLVLVAAACIGSTEKERDPRTYTILAGISELTLASLEHGQKRNVTKIIFNDPTNPSIAILRLENPIVLNNKTNVRRISFEQFLGWRTCTLIQWGNTKKTSTTSWTLLKLDMHVYDSNRCRLEAQMFKDTDLNRTMCAFQSALGRDSSDSKKPVCRGGGTVLFCDNVVSGFLRRRKEKRCDLVNQTSVYTDIGCFANWTKNFAPVTFYNGKIEYRKVMRTIRHNQSNNIHAIVFLSFSSALALFIFT